MKTDAMLLRSFMFHYPPSSPFTPLPSGWTTPPSPHIPCKIARRAILKWFL